MYKIIIIKIFNNAGKEIARPEKQTNNNQPARALLQCSALLRTIMTTTAIIATVY